MQVPKYIHNNVGFYIQVTDIGNMNIIWEELSRSCDTNLWEELSESCDKQ